MTLGAIGKVMVNQARQIGAVLAAPRSAFEQRWVRSWLTPYVLYVFVGVLSAQLLAQWMMVLVEGTPAIGPEHSKGLRVGLVFASIISPLIGPLLVAYVTGTVALLLGLIIKEIPTWDRVFGLVMWSLIPQQFFGKALQAVGLLFRPDGFDTSLAVVVSPEFPPLRVAFGFIDPFALWTSVLLVVGYSCLTRRPLRSVWFVGLAPLILPSLGRVLSLL